MLVAIYVLGICSLFAVICFGIIEIYDSLHKAQKPARLLVLFLSLFVLSIYLTRNTAIRGGYDNNHDFGYMAVQFWGEGPQVVSYDKESSPLIMFALIDHLSGFSLSGILVAQKILWFLSSLLLFAVLRRSGLGLPASVFGAGFLFFNFLSILNTYTFATTNINVFYFMSAIYALTAFLFASKRHCFYLAWFMSASFLVFTSRFEFFPVLIMGFILSMFFGGFDRLNAIWSSNRSKRILLPVAGCFLLACFMWGYELFLLAPRHTTVLEDLLGFVSILNFQLGEQNLGALFNIPSGFFGWIIGILLLIMAVVSFKRKSKICPLTSQRTAPFEGSPSACIFWILFLSGWLLYFSMIYIPLSLYNLHFIRHHLYFFLPGALLAGFVCEAMDLNFAANRSRNLKLLFIMLIVSGYFFVNLKHVTGLQNELRTNDIEWQFIYAARKEWPSQCRSTNLYSDDRSGLLRKYFPYVDPQEISSIAGNGQCVLFYNSPKYQVFKRIDGEWVFPQDRLEVSYAHPFKEKIFRHRFYTIWGDEGREIVDPIQVRMGFYKIERAFGISAGR